MLRRILLPTIFLILGWGFWVSPDFKEIAAGVAIFLFGMLSLEEGFKAFTGGVLEKLLRVSTDRLWKSLSFGIVTTTVMQSSSLVSVITISFLSAGLIGLAQGIGIIFGANMGTTTGAWLIAGLGLKVNIAAYAMPMLVFGIILMFQSSKNLKGIGYVLSGLGFLFLGIHHMKEGFESFKSAIDLSQFAVPGLLGLLLYTLIGTFATVVMQSSHATLVLIITALAAGQITYENALALAIGANIGTTITAILGAISANAEGWRLAAAHLLFNVVTGLVAIVFIHQFVWAVDALSIRVGIANDDYALKLAVFHTLFNLTGVLIMVPFIQRMVTVLQRMFKEEVRTVVCLATSTMPLPAFPTLPWRLCARK
ncbi:MAG: Na/Pi symporter [Azonexus sp.]